MKNTSRISWNRNIIISIAVLLIFAITLAVTGAVFFGRKTVGGTVEFDNGVILEFKNGTTSANEESIYLTHYQKGSEAYATTVTPFLITDANPGDQYLLANPEIKAASNSMNFYTRAKVEFYSTEEGNPVLTDEQLQQLFGTTTPLTLGAGWASNYYYVENDDDVWSYYVGVDGDGNTNEWNVGPNTTDLVTFSSSDSNYVKLFAETPVYFNETATGDNGVFLQVQNRTIGEGGEQWLVSGFGVRVVIEAVEMSAVENAFGLTAEA